MLTETVVRACQPKDKPYRLYDGRGGLYLEVSTKGGRYWRVKYRYDGKERRLALGVYPEVTLTEARLRCERARAKLAAGIDPSPGRYDVQRDQRQRLALTAQRIAGCAFVANDEELAADFRLICMLAGVLRVGVR